MKRLTISAILFLFIMGAGLSAFAHTSLKGTWVLKNIKSYDKNKMSVSTVEEVSKELYYTCPGKITFEEEMVCTLYYDNGEEKEALYYVIPEGTSIYFSVPTEGTIPEHQFFLDWNQEDSDSIQLQYSKQEENTEQEEKYIYNYQLQK